MATLLLLLILLAFSYTRQQESRTLLMSEFKQIYGFEILKSGLRINRLSSYVCFGQMPHIFAFSLPFKAGKTHFVKRETTTALSKVAWISECYEQCASYNYRGIWLLPDSFFHMTKTINLLHKWPWMLLRNMKRSLPLWEEKSDLQLMPWPQQSTDLNVRNIAARSLERPTCQVNLCCTPDAVREIGNPW